MTKESRLRDCFLKPFLYADFAESRISRIKVSSQKKRGSLKNAPPYTEEIWQIKAFCIGQVTVEQKPFYHGDTETQSFSFGFLRDPVSPWFKKVCNLSLTITQIKAFRPYLAVSFKVYPELLRRYQLSRKNY
jgi:hypothetical protein